MGVDIEPVYKTSVLRAKHRILLQFVIDDISP